MPKKPAAYHRPETIQDALRLIAQPSLVPLGGGTKLLATEAGFAGEVVDLQSLGLGFIHWELASNRLQVGAMCRLAQLAHFVQTEPLPAGPVELLAMAIHRAGPNTYRQAATVGGCIASRLAQSELLAALLVLDTTLELRTPEPVTLSLADYLAAAERPSGLIHTISIPWSVGQGGSERVARTPADDPIVSVTLWKTGVQIRLAATGLAERPSRLPQAEQALTNGLAYEEAVRAACHHRGDFLGSTEYRRETAVILTRRLLAKA